MSIRSFLRHSQATLTPQYRQFSANLSPRESNIRDFIGNYPQISPS